MDIRRRLSRLEVIAGRQDQAARSAPLGPLTRRERFGRIGELFRRAAARLRGEGRGGDAARADALAGRFAAAAGGDRAAAADVNELCGRWRARRSPAGRRG